MNVALYLRKSRADIEQEKTGKFNTLSRHKDTLLKLAAEKRLSVIKIYEELVTGESINIRPEMISLLKEVNEGKFDAVLVMDIDRLGRGNMQEQGIIIDTFKESNTKIITPLKTYDLNNEFDEEYTEFESFMARKELKMITRRMQRGRIKSIEEGNYIGTYAPFGYKIEGYGRNRRLVVDPVAAEAVKLIFKMYSEGYGGTKIADELNRLGYTTITNKKFYNHSIINIIKNPVYTGVLTWKKKEYMKGNINKRRTVALKPRDEWMIFKGKHEPLISEELYNICYDQLKNRSHPPCKKSLTNPLAGVIFCKHCGSSMHYRPYLKSEPYIMCPGCSYYMSAKFRLIEDDILKVLESIVNEYNIVPVESKKEEIDTTELFESLEKELTKAEEQKGRLHDLLEQGVYDIDTFLNRQEALNKRISDIEEKLKVLKEEIKPPAVEVADKIKTVLEGYKASDNIELKNQLIKSVIKKVIYIREKGTKQDDFKLSIELNI